MRFSSLVDAHIPPMLTSNQSVSRSTKTKPSEDQKTLAAVAGSEGLTFRYDKDLLTTMCSLLEESWADVDIPPDLQEVWDAHMLVHKSHQSRNPTKTEIYQLHPIFEFQLFRLIQIIVLDHGAKLFKRNSRLRYTWGPARHVGDGTADAMCVNLGHSKAKVVMEIKMPEAPDVLTSKDVSEISIFKELAAERAGVRIAQTVEEDLEVTKGCPPRIAYDMLQVSEGVPALV